MEVETCYYSGGEPCKSIDAWSWDDAEFYVALETCWSECWCSAGIVEYYKV